MQRVGGGVSEAAFSPLDLIPGRAQLSLASAGFKGLATAAVAGFSRSGFRRGLAREAGEAVAGVHAHHVFPLRFKPELGALGIDVNDPGFGTWWEATSHLQNSRAYNQAWQEFLGTNPNRAQALQFGRDLMGSYGISTRF